MGVLNRVVVLTMEVKHHVEFCINPSQESDHFESHVVSSRENSPPPSTWPPDTESYKFYDSAVLEVVINGKLATAKIQRFNESKTFHV